MLPWGMVMAQQQSAWDHQGSGQEWVEFPKSGFQGLEVTLSPVPRAVLQAQKHMWHARAGCRWENPVGTKADTYGRSHTCGFKWHLWNEDQAFILGTACSSKPTERAIWDALFQDGKEVVTQPSQLVFFPPHLHVWSNHRYKHGFFTPQSQAVEMESVHAVSEGWGDDQLQHERHLVHQCYLEKHRSTLPDGSPGGQPLPRVMLLAMLPRQVLQQSGSADTAGVYCCLLISGCMQ